MSGKIKRKKLLVEGAEDKRVIPELIEANGIPWGTRRQPIVYIEDFDGIENLLAPKAISTELKHYAWKSSGCQILN